MSTTTKQPLNDKLPLTLDRFPCPICGAKVILTGVTEYGVDDGEIVHADFDCITEPDIDSDEWEEWHRYHYREPYTYWLPYQNSVLAWLNENYYYRDSEAQ